MPPQGSGKNAPTVQVRSQKHIKPGATPVLTILTLTMRKQNAKNKELTFPTKLIEIWKIIAKKSFATFVKKHSALPGRVIHSYKFIFLQDIPFIMNLLTNQSTIIFVISFNLVSNSNSTIS